MLPATQEDFIFLSRYSLLQCQNSNCSLECNCNLILGRKNMPYNFKNANLAVRESRLGSITGFTGDLQTLVYRSECGSLKNRERCFSQSSSCLSGCALNALAAIRNVAVVYHAPAGCTAMASNDAVKFGQIAARINATTHSVFISTDLNENDTVFGAIESLRKIVKHTYDEYKPDAIFISTSCVSGVIGENIDDLAQELKEIGRASCRE